MSSFSILFLMMSLISDGFSCCMPLSSNLVLKSGAQSLGHSGPLATNESLDNQVACTYYHAADQILINCGFKLNLALQLFGQCVDQFLLFVCRQFECGIDCQVHRLLEVCTVQTEQSRNLRQQGQTLVFSKNQQEVSECFRQRLFKTVSEEFRLALLRQAGVGQDVLYLLVSRNHSCESQSLIPLINGILVLRGFKNGFRVGSG